MSSALPRSYISGLNIAKVDATTVSVSDGIARSSDNTTDLTLTGTGGLTNIDFTSNTGLNSVETLPVSDVASWYSIWLVTDGTSTGLKAVNGSSAPAGYSAERRIAWVRVNSSQEVENFACTRSSSTVNVCATERRVFTISQQDLLHLVSALKDISASVPPNTKIANITLFNRHNNDPTANQLFATHYFSNTEILVAITKSNDGTFTSTNTGMIFLDISTPSTPKLKVWRKG